MARLYQQVVPSFPETLSGRGAPEKLGGPFHFRQDGLDLRVSGSRFVLAGRAKDALTGRVFRCGARISTFKISDFRRGAR